MWPTLICLWLALSGQAPTRPPPRRRPAFRRPSCRPRLEALEDRVTPSLSFSISTLASFNANNGYSGGSRGVIVDSSGNLYGATSDGGANGDGAVFELAKGSGTITTLASFNGSNGSNPEFGLLMDSSGNLYGTSALEEAPTAAAPCSNSPREAARSPPWRRSTPTTVST